MLEYISTEENEYLYIDGVSADEMPMEQLINIYKECMKSISTKPKDSIREFIAELLEAVGQMEFVFHCDQCGDSVYDHTIQTTHHKAVYTEGCTCYGVHFDEHDYDYPEVTQSDVVEFLNESYEYFVKNPDETVGQYVANHKCKIVLYVRLGVGEGIEKRKDDFVAEVMAAVNK